MWLDATTAKVREAEPVDLRVDRAILEAKHSQLVELARDLARCEPRVVSLQEAADQLELQADSPACRQVAVCCNGLTRPKFVLSGETQTGAFDPLSAGAQTSRGDLHRQLGSCAWTSCRDDHL